jgi:hypothetical protein
VTDFVSVRQLQFYARLARRLKRTTRVAERSPDWEGRAMWGYAQQAEWRWEQWQRREGIGKQTASSATDALARMSEKD